MKLTMPKRKMKKSWGSIEKNYLENFVLVFLFQKITFCTFLVAMKVDLFLASFFSLLLGMLIGVDKTVGFRHD